MIVGHPLENIINGPAHHTLHHMYFVYNYGQYFTWADKAGGSYRHPQTSDDPIHAILKLEEAKEMLKKEKELARKEQEEKQQLIPSITTAQRPLQSINLKRTESEVSDTESVRTASTVSEAQTPSDERSEDGHAISESDDEVVQKITVRQSDGELRKRKI